MHTFLTFVRSSLSYLLSAVFSLLVANLFLVMILAARGPVKLKMAGYRILRELVRKSLEIRTCNWRKLKGMHYEVRYRDKRDADVAPLVLETAEKFHNEVQELLAPRFEEKVLVLIYPDSESLASSIGCGSGESAMGVYWLGVIRMLSPREWVTGENIIELKNVFSSSGPMIHEYVHFLVDYLTDGNCPRWFSEGLAQYAEREVAGFQPPVPRARKVSLYSLNELEDDFDSLPDQRLAYWQSLQMVDYIVEKYGFNACRKILSEMNKGKKWGGALRQAVCEEPAQWEEGYRGRLVC